MNRPFDVARPRAVILRQLAQFLGWPLPGLVRRLLPESFASFSFRDWQANNAVNSSTGRRNFTIRGAQEKLNGKRCVFGGPWLTQSRFAGPTQQSRVEKCLPLR